jgi:hypothetical protein
LKENKVSRRGKKKDKKRWNERNENMNGRKKKEMK